MGYATVVFESTLSSVYFRRPYDDRLLPALSRILVWVQLGFVAFRLADLAVRGQLGHVLLLDAPAVGFLLEVALVIAGALMLATPAWRNDPGQRFRAAMVMMLAGGLYRFDTYLLAFNPGPQWSYFPSIPEMLMTLGIVAFEIAAYVAIVRTFPILRGVPAGRTV
jgi:Ni/Fe-hydrogenase subunit HybB-like protein